MKGTESPGTNRVTEAGAAPPPAFTVTVLRPTTTPSTEEET
jgi:hypothetical protein